MDAGCFAALQCIIPKADAREAVEIGQLCYHCCLWGFPGAESVTRIDFKVPLLEHQ